MSSSRNEKEKGRSSKPTQTRSRTRKVLMEERTPARLTGSHTTRSHFSHLTTSGAPQHSFAQRRPVGALSVAPHLIWRHCSGIGASCASLRASLSLSALCCPHFWASSIDLQRDPMKIEVILLHTAINLRSSSYYI
jgi:hypothetical protein